jgi:L-ascorbate metabolism protein UlaG (beta-lactamase superfamily)
MDHMDMASLDQMPATAQVITAAKTSDIIAGKPFKTSREMRWGDKLTVATRSGDVEIESVEVKHWGARWKIDDYRGYGGYLLKRGGKTILFGGDTAYTSAFKSLRNEKIDLAIMPIGSYGSGGGNHCTPEESVQMVNECGANFIVPIHHSTFPIGREPLEEPLARLEEAVDNDRIAIKQIGQVWRLPA